MKKWIIICAFSGAIPMMPIYAMESRIYELNPIIVTAMKYEKNDGEIPSSTEVYTREDLEKSGTTNVISALSNMLGVTYMGYGPEGSSLGDKNSNLMIRGVDKGTLVMINGAPINLNGKYNLEDMPFDGIKRIEVVRGGGSVLYGSEAIGGVINIITADTVKNKASIAVGNYGRRQYGISYQLGKLSAAVSSKHWGSSSISSDLITSEKKMNNYMRNMERNSIYLNYRFNDSSNLLFQHTESEKNFDYVFGDGYQGLTYYQAVRYNRLYKYNKNFVQYIYNDNDIKMNFYYHNTDTKTDSVDFYSSKGSNKGYPVYQREKDRNYMYGTDITKIWNNHMMKTLVGVSYRYENYNPDRYAGISHDKNSYSIYGQIEKPFGDRNTLVVSGRQSWDEMDEKSFHNLSGQIQFIHKLNDTDSIYFNVGQSYRMPYLKEMYASGKNYLIGNTDLKPERGIHSEIGWKKQEGNHFLKVALFQHRIKDNIAYTMTRSGGQVYSTNQDAKNAGIEASYGYEGDDGWKYGIGIAYGNPKVKSRSDNAPSSVTVKDYWDRQFGRWQINGKIGYEKGKWEVNFIGNYMFDRVASPSSSESFAIKPYFLTSLNLKYMVTNQSDITFSLENVLNREDNFGGSTTAYYSTPKTYLLRYSYEF